ncbi:PLP-dependent aminotransferase family protein [Pseudomonas citronellolis]|uniref:MocR-like pyridoxine biosynthesis transcription factor PdxR n=1 Tax=Pseudomonas citronellolis TaxID=53408 RepID=UPI0023E43A50|nr:PLP-dependent aminotransferase family protein [Pseudomonas citronellolis]MDF3934188.1 PLP-dependent aminotransferase family protein [Pseudomonas citronellolis]
MELHIVIQGDKDLGGQLYAQLRAAIDSGRLAAGTRLPPSRLLAGQLELSRKTVADVYAQLTYEGVLVGRVGSGTFVNARVPRHEQRPAGIRYAAQAAIDEWQALQTRLSHPHAGATLRANFLGGASSLNSFPQEDWRRCVHFALRQMQGPRAIYSQPEGLPSLRDAIARHVAYSRGVQCRDDDVIVCNGAQQALDLLARVLVRPGTRVAMEDPGYPPARLLFAMQGAEVASVPVDAEGLCPERIPDGTQLIYCTPAHQFPLGMPLSDARRQALLARAAELGAVIIEDDYDSEFRYQGRPDQTLHSLDRQGLVAYVGTFSKTLLPELRLGYLIVPPGLRPALLRARQLNDWHSSTLAQWALAKFIGDGCLLKHIRRCHGIYATRRERILARVEGDLAPWLEAVPSTAGFHLTLLFRVPVKMALLVELARKLEVGLYPLDGFYDRETPRQGLLMGFGAIEVLDIDPALDKLRDLLKQIT